MARQRTLLAQETSIRACLCTIIWSSLVAFIWAKDLMKYSFITLSPIAGRKSRSRQVLLLSLGPDTQQWSYMMVPKATRCLSLVEKMITENLTTLGNLILWQRNGKNAYVATALSPEMAILPKSMETTWSYMVESSKCAKSLMICIFSTWSKKSGAAFLRNFTLHHPKVLILDLLRSHL